MPSPVISSSQQKFITSERGFTLLEVLAVLFIIGIIVSFASISVNQNTSRVLEDEANRLYGLVRIASEEAVLKGQELALQFNPKSYTFVRQDKDEQWQPVTQDNLLREREIPAGIELELIHEGVAMSLDNEEQPPRILLLSSGELSPFELTLSTADGSKYILRGDISGHLELKKVDADA